VSNSSLFTPALLKTHSFVFFAVHETRTMINLLQLFYITRSLSTNSHVAANLQKVIHVLVGLLMQRTSCHLLLWKVGLGKLKSKGVRNCKSVTRFYCWRWINNSGEFSYVEYVCSLGLPKFQCTWSALAGGFISRAVGFIHEWQRTVFLLSFGYWGQNVDLPLGPVKQIRIYAVEGRGSLHIYTNL